MKRVTTRILIEVLIVFSIIFLGAHLFLVFQGRNFIIGKLQQATGKKTTIAEFSVSAPMNIHISGLNIDGLAEIDSVHIAPSMRALLFGKIALNRIIINKPKFTFQRFAPEALPIVEAQSSKAASAEPKQGEPVTQAEAEQMLNKPPAIPLRLIIKEFIVRDGALNFIDRTVGPQALVISARDIQFKLTNLYMVPRSAITSFELKGNIPWKEGQEQGKIEAEGWFNFHKRSMLASLKIKDIDGVYLYPYYSTWVDLDKARIESAKLNFTSEIHGANNNVTADCHLELTDIVRTPRPEDQPQEKAEKITDVVLDIFRALDQGKITLDFTIRTKMDRPEFGFGNIKMAFEDKLAKSRKPSFFKPDEIFGFPAMLVQGTFKGLTDLTAAVIGGTINAGKQIGKTVEDAVKSKEEPEKEPPKEEPKLEEKKEEVKLEH